MGINSIKGNLTKEDIISDIKLTLSADIKKEKVILIVEGQDDFKLLRKLVNNNVDIIESFSGKDGIKEIIEQYFNNEIRVIGVRDKDYATNQVHDKIFFYDYCCWEMMAISYEELFNNIYCEYYISGSLNYNELLGTLLNKVRHISLFRKYNEENGLGINFKGISMCNIIEDSRTSFDKLMDEIKKKNPRWTDEKLKVKFKDVIEKLSQECTIKGLLDTTQGHDFIGMFQHYCKKDKGKDITKDDISASLRCTFRKYHFKQTNLYKTLSTYEDISKLKIIS
ncbi:DUF4435 domain-containing protein [Clostridium estertheticum]|uniref:DUF4435 domain-containing protein n=1 Tax=Clostridium estertheticum TaxID=238834 RepID=UPI001C7CB78B|nr:DUF4435 domain-containing protein [Clostridium estertheticum]MBX4268443.1 DUF4435 domain-containing protein [Clostridium estertheticum]WLC81497.1 DUF4435 domain-containing protein [Clostridium estertheticum]